ncbi:MAG: FAD-dependent oxidoreductase [Gammaproteobacteria bacterium]|nr:FAD-dependent oxidoreductase [Gammaproteobacteria bacterium]
MAKLPARAEVVIVGQGGIVGACVAHHLIEQGWTDIVGLDKSAIPSDISSTSHASDFCFMTDHSKFNIYTTQYSRRFYEARGSYARVGGLEVARVGADARLAENLRKGGSGQAFGTRATMVSPAEAKTHFPLLDETRIQGAMWDPDAGLVVPRSQKVVGDLVDEAVATGRIEVFANTAVERIEVEGGRVRGVHTTRGFVEADIVVLSTGIWGPILAATAGVSVPLMPTEHPLLFFGPYDGLAGTGKEIGHALLRDQGNSSYVRDTGDPKTVEGGKIEWGYYEMTEPRLVWPRQILEPHEARLSPSMRDLELDQVMQGFERMQELTPILGELGWEEKHSFNGLLSVTSDGSSIVGEAPGVRGFWIAEAVWIKDGPGIGKVLADWLTKGAPEMDPYSVDIARHYPIQGGAHYVYGRCFEGAQKIYNPPVHPREPYLTGRDLRRSPFWPREVELGGYFMEVAGWERAHGYRSNETRLARYMERVPERENEWDARHFWRVSNAEQLAMSDDVGMVNLSHFAIYDVSGPDAEPFMEYLCVAKVGGTTPTGKGVYTHFLDHRGGIRADITVIRLDRDRYRVVSGGPTGHRDLVWMQRVREDRGFDAVIEDRSDGLATLGLWGPNARATLARFVDDPESITPENFPFATARTLRIRGMPVWAFRISYVGEQGWELYFPFSYGLAIWDLLFEAGVVPVGIETYANTRRLEKSLRLQNADLETNYNLYEADLARPKVKPADFFGKAAYLEQRAHDSQPATLCTLTMVEHVDARGMARYPVGTWPILDADGGEVLVDRAGRRSYTNSIAYGPTIGKNIILAYIPHELAVEGAHFTMEYFGERYPIVLEAVGYRALYDPENARMRS